MAAYECDQCQKSYKNKRNLKRHLSNHSLKIFRCPQCPAKFHRSDYLESHIRSNHRRKPSSTANPSNATPATNRQSIAPTDSRNTSPTAAESEDPRINQMMAQQAAMFQKMKEMSNTIKELKEKKARKRKAEEPETPTSKAKSARIESNFPELDEPGTSHQSDSQSNEEPEQRQEEPAIPPDWRPEDYLTMTCLGEKESEALKTTQKEYRVLIDSKAFDTDVIDRENFHQYQDRLTALLQAVLDKAREMAPPNAQGWFACDFEGLNYKRQKWVRLINSRYDNIHLFTVNDILFEVERTLNSNESVKIRNGFKVFINFTDVSTGGSRNTEVSSFGDRSVYNVQDFRHRKKTVLDVSKNAPHGDQMCCARSLIVGKFIADHGPKFSNVKGLKTLRDSRRKLQGRKAEELHATAQVPNNIPCTIEDVAHFQAVLPNYQIYVYEFRGHEMEIIYPANLNAATKKKRIYLWLHENHFSLINPFKLSGFLGTDYHCATCHQSWNRDPKHVCRQAICKKCKLPNCENRQENPRNAPIPCAQCNRSWPTQACKVAHEAKVCVREARCWTCQLLVPRRKLAPELHHCMLNRCQFCHEYKPPGHNLCHVQKPGGNKEECDENDEDLAELLGNNSLPEEDLQQEEPHLNDNVNAGQPTLYLCDIECEVESETGRHNPILICVLHENGAEKWHWRGPDCIDRYIQALLEDDQFKNSIQAYHNFSAYDGIFILERLHKLNLNPNAIFRASRVLTMSLKKRKIKFLDTYLHTSMALNRLPAAYAFQAEASKGWFPYLFACEATRGYIGPLPEMKYFDVENMTKKQYKEFELWYRMEQQRYRDNPGLQYNLDEEMLKYCEMDCEVLRRGFGAYRETYKGIFKQIDPANFITLPSYINYCYRALGMQKETVAILPPRGYSCDSKIAICWLEWEAKQRQIRIKHGRNGPEIKIASFYVDGFSEAENEGERPLVFEFEGCHFHGCRDCHPNRGEMHEGSSYEEKYKATLEKNEFLRARGYTVITKWECKFMAEIERDEELKAFYEELFVQRLSKYSPLCPRDALRGGRSNAVRLSYTPKTDETLHYKDFTSLYPSCQMGIRPEQVFPVSHPDIYLHSFKPIEEAFGIIKCVVECPKQLFLPVLPTFSHGKVLFALCNRCIAENNNREMCTHTDEERLITDTFVSVELQRAVQLGYRVKKVIEQWDWPESRRSSDLFEDFLKKSYTMKVQASGWPPECDTEEEKRRYIAEYKEKQNITIDYDKVSKNPALRENCKLSINNQWGYLGKKPIMGRTKYVTKYSHYLDLLYDQTKEIVSTYLVNENLLAVEYQAAPGYEKPDPKANAVLACFVTAYARLTLYNELEKLQDRVLYFDTDSIIYILRPGLCDLESGRLLGELTCEITGKYGPDATIGKFIAGGSKCYQLTVVHKNTGQLIDVIMKHKGIRPSLKSGQVLTPATMERVIEQKEEIRVPQMIMSRNRKEGHITTKYMEKRLRQTFSKRIVPQFVEDVSLPIGYKLD